MNVFQSRPAKFFNAAFLALRDAPVVGPLLGRSLVEISWVGRTSGKTFSTPVNYRRTGDSVVIGVMAPDQKKWWRNFLGEGGPITLKDLDGSDRSGHAVATRDDAGKVLVKVALDSTT